MVASTRGVPVARAKSSSPSRAAGEEKSMTASASPLNWAGEEKTGKSRSEEPRISKPAAESFQMIRRSGF